MVTNMENHPFWAALVAKSAALPWPQEYQGAPRLIVSTVRGMLVKGETLNLKIIALAKTPAKSVVVYYRKLGAKEWQTVAASNIARATWQAKIPAATEDFEYHIVAETATGTKLTWPATAPETQPNHNCNGVRFPNSHVLLLGILPFGVSKG